MRTGEHFVEWMVSQRSPKGVVGASKRYTFIMFVRYWWWCQHNHHIKEIVRYCKKVLVKASPLEATAWWCQPAHVRHCKAL